MQHARPFFILGQFAFGQTACHLHADAEHRLGDFNMLTLHASSGVGGNNRRRAFSVRVIGDDVRHAPRPWATSPEFPGLREVLAADVPMEHELFPPLWQRPLQR